MPAPLEATMFAIIPSRPEVGDMSAKVWPHISVVPWVQLGDYRHEVLTEAQQIVEETTPLDLRPGAMEMVGGVGHEKRAQRIVSERLPILHKKLLYSLGSFGIVVSHPEWAGRNYSPHITSEKPALLSRTIVDTVYVVDNLALDGGDRGTKVITERLGRRAY